MTQQDILKLLSTLRAAYPRFYANMTSEEKWQQVALYQDMLGDLPESVVATALARYIKHNEYPPTIAGLQKEIDQMTEAVSDNNYEGYAKEAWDAVCGNRKYDDLSDPVKEFFGSQQAIDAIGQDERTIYTVFLGQLQRRLPDILARQKARKEMPPVIADVIRGMLAEETRPALETKGE